MSDLIYYLGKLNRKERFSLIGEAIGNHIFALSEEFRNRLGECLGLNIPIGSFNAIDYHIDWIYASIILFNDNEQNVIYYNSKNYIKANQQDLDLFIAFKEIDKYHLIMIEAKWKSSWLNEQTTSKVERLKGIFGEDRCKWNNIIPHFVFISPRKPTKLDYSEFPKWMKPDGSIKWLALPDEEKIKVTKCDWQGKTSRNGLYWKVEKN